VNASPSLVVFVQEHGTALLLGVTIVLACGLGALLLHRAPAQRRRLGTATALGAFAYLVVASFPLPRGLAPTGSTTAAHLTPATVSASAPARTPFVARVHAPPTVAKGTVEPTRDLAATPPPVAPPTDDPIAWSHWLTIAFLAGSALVLLRHVLGILRLVHVLRGCTPVPADLLRAAGMAPGTRTRVAARDIRPFCVGVFAPTIVLPTALLTPERRHQALAVLRHEAAHAQAGDCRTQALFAVLDVVLFWHPLFWWLRREVRFASELLADDAAARAFGRDAYAHALLDLADRDVPRLVAAGTVAVFHRPSEFYRRIQMLLQQQTPLSAVTSKARRAVHALATIALVGVAASTFGVPVRAQEPEATAEENQRLRTEIGTMRAEIEQMRTLLRRLQNVQPAEPAPPPQPSSATPAPDMAGTSPATDPVQTPAPNLLNLLARQPDPPATPDAAGNAAMAVVELTNRYLDLQAEKEVAEQVAAEARTLAEQGLKSALESKRATVHAETVQRKLTVVRKLLDGEIAATRSEVEMLERRLKGTTKTERMSVEAQIARAKTRLEALLTVL
jgi:beta-lactamase regulating signal transducer with metallopeptidase domain